MSTYEAISIMIMFSVFVISLIALVVALFEAILRQKR